MGNDSAKKFGLEKADITLEKSLRGLTKVVSAVKHIFLSTHLKNWLTKEGGQIDNSTRADTSGRFMVYDGTSTPW